MAIPVRKHSRVASGSRLGFAKTDKVCRHCGEPLSVKGIHWRHTGTGNKRCYPDTQAYPARE